MLFIPQKCAGMRGWALFIQWMSCHSPIQKFVVWFTSNSKALKLSFVATNIHADHFR